tara:strand:- start:5506 stop:6039 length:534 start_codon:yes stop_codon:yes gene_type:complete
MTTQTDLTFEYFWEVIAVKRRLMEVEFKFNNLHWKVYGLHLKSKWSDFEEDPQSDDQRRSEVLATRKRILEKQKDDALPFLIMSDLNETKGTSTIRLLQKRGDYVVASAVDCVDSRDHWWTQYYENEDEYRPVDFIIMSRDFPAKLVGEKGHIFDGADGLFASDHRFVRIDLEWGEH